MTELGIYPLAKIVCTHILRKWIIVELVECFCFVRGLCLSWLAKIPYTYNKKLIIHAKLAGQPPREL